MGLGSEEVPGSKGYILSSYRDGLYQPNGGKTDSVLNDRAMTAWENDNRPDGIFAGKLWGAGQALFFDGTGKSLVCGRQPDVVDLVVDSDPDLEYGFAGRNQKVSRKHFEIFPPDKNGLIGIKDLNSKNGTAIFPADIKDFEELHDNQEPKYLNIGDLVILDSDFGEEEGANSTEGFRVCKDVDGKTFMVKFNIKGKEEFFSLFGLVTKRTEEGKIINEKENDLNTFLSDLTSKMESLHSLNNNSIAYLEANSDLFKSLFDGCRTLGERYYDGEWDMAATAVSRVAVERSDSEQDPGLRSRQMEVALLTIKFASKGLVEKVSD